MIRRLGWLSIFYSVMSKIISSKWSEPKLKFSLETGNMYLYLGMSRVVDYVCEFEIPTSIFS